MENEWKVAREGKKRERCCFCFDLRRGVIRLASAKLAAACLLLLIGIINLMEGSDTSPTTLDLYSGKGWPDSLSYFIMAVSLVSLPFTAVGLHGSRTKRENFVYTYFVYTASMVALSAIGGTVLIIMVATGRGAIMFRTLGIVDWELMCTAKHFTDAQCERAKKAFNLEMQRHCFRMVVMFFISVGKDSYFAYVIRRLYLKILMEKTRESLLPCYKPPQLTEAIAESITF